MLARRPSPGAFRPRTSCCAHLCGGQAGHPGAVPHTVHHFAETYAYRDELARRWQLNLIDLRAADRRRALADEHRRVLRASQGRQLFGALDAYGRGSPASVASSRRRAPMATGGSWRWQMSSPLGDTAHDLFWQQLLRWLVSDTPGHVAASVPAQMLLDNGAVTLTAEVRDQQYNPAPDAKVEAHILGPSGVSALVEMTPVPDSPGQFQAAWSAPKTGAYLTEVTAQRADPNTGTVKELGRDVLTFQRMDGVAENFHTEQNRDLLERLAAQTGGQYWKPADLGKLAGGIPFSEAGVTMRETKDLWNLPLVFLVLLLLRFSEWWLRRKWGIV